MAAGTAMVTIDGAHGEGGGGLLRCALAMSALTQQPLRLIDVRGGTRHAGLDPEDITIIRAMAESCSAETSGIETGSGTFSFVPTRAPKGLNGRLQSFRNEMNRGPNALVVLNTLLPLLAGSGVYCSVIAEGETYGLNALGFDAFANTTVPALRKLGLYTFPTLNLAGFGRESSGEVGLDVEPSYLEGTEFLTRGSLVEVGGVVATSRLGPSVAERAIAHLGLLAKGAEIRLEVEHIDSNSSWPGCHITLWARYERGFGGSAAMGARTIRVEALAQSAFEDLIDWMSGEACLDPYVADQILIPCCIANGPSSFSVSRLTQRFLTSVWVIKQFTPIHITIRGSENRAGTVVIKRGG